MTVHMGPQMATQGSQIFEGPLNVRKPALGFSNPSQRKFRKISISIREFWGKKLILIKCHIHSWKICPHSLAREKSEKTRAVLWANKDGTNGADWGEMERKFIGNVQCAVHIVHPEPRRHCCLKALQCKSMQCRVNGCTVVECMLKQCVPQF